MPTYSYHCEACEADFEKEQRITEAPAKKCPACGKLKARRMISGGNFILKGGGWYSDAYGLKPDKKSSTSSESSDKDSSSTGVKVGADAPKSTPVKAGGDTAKPGASGS